MTIDATTLAIVSAVGSTGVAVGGGLWAYIKTLHNSTVKELKAHNHLLHKRLEGCRVASKKPPKHHNLPTTVGFSPT